MLVLERKDERMETWKGRGWRLLPQVPEGFRLLEPKEKIPRGKGYRYILWWGFRCDRTKAFDNDGGWDRNERDGSLGGKEAAHFIGFVGVRIAPEAPKIPRKSPKRQETSVHAHRSQKDKAPGDCALILGRLRKYRTGATCDKLEQVLGMSHQTVSARLRDLAMAGKIVDSGRREKTRTGRPAICWKVVE